MRVIRDADDARDEKTNTRQIVQKLDVVKIDPRVRQRRRVRSRVTHCRTPVVSAITDVIAAVIVT